MHHSKIVNKGPSKTNYKQDTDSLLEDHSGKAHHYNRLQEAWEQVEEQGSPKEWIINEIIQQ